MNKLNDKEIIWLVEVIREFEESEMKKEMDKIFKELKEEKFDGVKEFVEGFIEGYDCDDLNDSDLIMANSILSKLNNKV